MSFAASSGLAAWATGTPLRTATEPFFKLLSEPKLLTLYDGGHVPSLEVLMSTTMPWLEEQLGRVGR